MLDSFISDPDNDPLTLTGTYYKGTSSPTVISGGLFSISSLSVNV
jgi:hypothetical protein